ncbi:hypothetical protein [Streptomyces cavernae]|uniref:hypothetical protein n=1 Tax=Streptomyces cavernae TaxID=2259034 RepID=UPI000FEC1096|nr:hypothetical protein [Streptomyces cavernae]
MATKTIYTITTADDTKVDVRSEGKAADKLADKLTADTGLVHRVYTPTGKLRYETEVVEAAPADDVPAVDINEAIEEVLAEDEETETAEGIDEAPESEADEVAEEDVTEAVEDVEGVEEAAAEVADAAVEPAAGEGDEEAPAAKGFVSYATLMDLLKSDDETVRNDAKAKWDFRLEVYKKRTVAKDPAERIVGPAMAAALELGETTDGRTRASLAKRGLIEVAEDKTFTVLPAGKAALAAAIAAVTPGA